ncbi:hypothetical protein B0I35DRAFT_28002 [Stachybotrys elegans]|uniref:Uncharacterized protein n=1 Tax=Stachybotrys elegans TaxID=80388 RepID=A0A8K0SZ91_9HYPO|nr:hypothetical protein B0I35DRAFT_28002 [Stachybotrys elegans]
MRMQRCYSMRASGWARLTASQWLTLTLMLAKWRAVAPRTAQPRGSECAQFPGTNVKLSTLVGAVSMRWSSRRGEMRLAEVLSRLSADVLQGAAKAERCKGMRLGTGRGSWPEPDRGRSVGAGRAEILRVSAEKLELEGMEGWADGAVLGKIVRWEETRIGPGQEEATATGDRRVNYRKVGR